MMLPEVSTLFHASSLAFNRSFSFDLSAWNGFCINSDRAWHCESGYLVFLCAFVKQFLIHFHKKLESIVYETVDRLVPVVFTVPVEGGEHDGKDGGRVVTDQTHNVPETWSRLQLNSQTVTDSVT